MVINEDSWHYKLYGLTNSCPPDSLCPYVWGVIFRILLPVAAVFLVFCTVEVWYRFFYYSGEFTWFMVLRGFIGLVATYCAAMFSCVALCILVHGWWTNRDSYTGTKEPSIFAEYAKATHSKVCPKLEFRRK